MLFYSNFESMMHEWQRRKNMQETQRLTMLSQIESLRQKGVKMNLINFDESLTEDFKKIDIESQRKYQNDWRDGMPEPGDKDITAIRYCHKKRVDHYVAMTQGEEMDHSGVSHLVKIMWWLRAEAHFIEEVSRQALNSE